MATILGISPPKEDDGMITKQRLKEFYKRLHARPSKCHVCAGTGRDVATLGEKEWKKCGACVGSGKTAKLAVVADAMTTAGATDDDLLEWLGPLLEPERQLGVIRYGGRVNIEMGVQGAVMEGRIEHMEVNQQADYVGDGFGGRRDFSPGHRTCEVTLSISEYDFRSPKSERTSPGDKFLDEHPPVGQRRSASIESGRLRRSYPDDRCRCVGHDPDTSQCPMHHDEHEWIDIATFGGSGIEQCVVCDIRRPLDDVEPEPAACDSCRHALHVDAVCGAGCRLFGGPGCGCEG